MKNVVPQIYSRKSRTINNFIYLFFQKSHFTCCLSVIASSWIDGGFPQSAWSGYGIEFRLQWRIGPQLRSRNNGNVVCWGAPRIPDYKANVSWLIGDQFRRTRGVSVQIGTELTDFGIPCDSSGSFCRLCKPIGRFDGVPSVDAGVPHLSQLISDQEVTPHSGTTQHNRSTCQNSSPNDQRPRFPLAGLCLLIVGAGCAAGGAIILCRNRRGAIFAGAG